MPPLCALSIELQVEIQIENYEHITYLFLLIKKFYSNIALKEACNLFLYPLVLIKKIFAKTKNKKFVNIAEKESYLAALYSAII